MTQIYVSGRYLKQYIKVLNYLEENRCGSKVAYCLKLSTFYIAICDLNNLYSKHLIL